MKVFFFIAFYSMLMVLRWLGKGWCDSVCWWFYAGDRKRNVRKHGGVETIIKKKKKEINRLKGIEI